MLRSSSTRAIVGMNGPNSNRALQTERPEVLGGDILDCRQRFHCFRDASRRKVLLRVPLAMTRCPGEFKIFPGRNA